VKFLTNYVDEIANEKKYIRMIQRIATRDDKTMIIDLDDILSVSHPLSHCIPSL
jgi:hypothetical protein